ncbi:CRISPR-associated endonuclease Cas1 [Emticicia sp. BO119]|uniref:CRISPR-associated endonuclease Cas1 n=1 Tax=Emticicia sp. BO119 TaxID=2757768 RepID=UPI0015F019CF|nr:CRISPR-associated endonuclease Cas1 [Emticicia sp. BO119]MBA4848980.1 CRISPR-associated endonuclease Cas1 [Emticicia sp. BO119]
MHLVLDTKGINMQVRNACFYLKTDKHERIINPHKISSISVLSQCWLSSSAIRLAVQHRIPIYFHNGLGNIEARLWSASFGHLATNRRQQVLFSTACQATEWIISLFDYKAQEQIKNLRYLKSRKTAQADPIEKAIEQITGKITDLHTHKTQRLSDCAASVMGKEGAIARCYWQALTLCMPDNMQFDNRNRRPAHDNFNAALNYLYGMLYGVIENALFTVGLDPYLGLLHADEYNQPTLAFDMIEPFRPWADRLLLEAILKSEMKDSFFEPRNEGIWLSKAGKQFFIPRFDSFFAEKTIFRNKTLSRNAQIYRIAGDFLEILNNFTE